MHISHLISVSTFLENFDTLRIAEILQTDGRTDGHQVFEQRA
jgi:hypothetical protein